MSRNVLVAVAPIPPAPVDNGYSLRVSGILGELTRHWDTVLVAPPVPAGVETSLEDQLFDYISVDLGGSVATMPWQLDIETLETAVSDVLRRLRPDAALLWAGTEVLGFADGFVPAVADRIDSATLASLRMTNSPSPLSRRLRMAARAAMYERRVVRRMSATVVVGEDDARMLRRVSGRGSIQVVPNGVDLGPSPEESWLAGTPTVIFTGVMNFHPNVDAAVSFARDVWPLVHESLPNARFVVAGRDPRDRVIELGSIPGVSVLPDVPDLRAEQRKAWVAVAPMRSGCGIKNKILEAWACGKPVVMSSLAANGLAEGHEDAGAIADAPRLVADEVIRLLEDNDERQRLGWNGYRLVEKHHSWSGAAGRISELLHLARRTNGRSPTQSDVAGATANSAKG
jgi:glycosyltransferase involved in cell wall biosynthesis